MIVLIFIFVTVMPPMLPGKVQIAAYKYPLMHYVSYISEEIFTPGLPLVIVQPLSEEDSVNEEVEYLIQELHKSHRWPILVFSVSYEITGKMYTEIPQHGSYIILISGTCHNGEGFLSSFRKQLLALSEGMDLKLWKPSTRFLIPVVSNCANLNSTNISRTILSQLWTYQVMNAAVLFLKSNEHAGNDLQQNTTDSAQGTYLELHTWYPYENSDRCNPAEGTVPVKVFTVRSYGEIRRSEITKSYFIKNFHGCPIRLYLSLEPPFVIPPKRVWYSDSVYQDVYEDGWEIQLLKIIRNTLNLSLAIHRAVAMDYQKCHPCIYLGGYMTYTPSLSNMLESTRSYLNVRFTWYTPCAVQYQRWSRFFNIFSVDMWICFALSLVLAVITVSCISN